MQEEATTTRICDGTAAIIQTNSGSLSRAFTQHHQRVTHSGSRLIFTVRSALMQNKLPMVSDHFSQMPSTTPSHRLCALPTSHCGSRVTGTLRLTKHFALRR